MSAALREYEYSWEPESSENEEKRRIFEKYEKLHKIAAAALILERFLRSPAFKDQVGIYEGPSDINLIADEQLKRHLTLLKGLHNVELDSQTIEVFKAVVVDYYARCSEQAEGKHQLEIIFQRTKAAHPKEKTSKETLMGDILYRQVMGGRPSIDTIKVFDEDAFFVVYCCNDRDYEDLIWAGGAKYEENDTSVGSYHRSFGVKFDGTEELLTILLIRGMPSNSTYENIKPVVQHESQHFINDTIARAHSLGHGDNFNTLEKKFRSNREPQLNAKLAAQGIKDEFLAFLRDGVSGAEIYEAVFFDPAYQHLYVNLTDIDREKIKQALVLACSEIDSAPTYSVQEDCRATLVYLLIGVPLTEFPRVIFEYFEYLRQRQERIEGLAHAHQNNPRMTKKADYYASNFLTSPLSTEEIETKLRSLNKHTFKQGRTQQRK